MSETNPLNPVLYAKLKQIGGRVKMANEGEAFNAEPITDILSGKTLLEWEQTGETYRISCPFCSDTRYRLYVNHMFGRKDKSGRQMNFLAHCHNETNCMGDVDHRHRFMFLLGAGDEEFQDAPIRKGVVVPEGKRVYTMPGPCTRLDQLEQGHEARSYVSGRQFDPDRLARTWGVSFCHDSFYFLARQRIVIPIFLRGKLRGWQCRYTGELDWKDRSNPIPKYFTHPGMKKSQILCNVDMARKYHTGVLVEGWFDIFGFGPMAICSLGDYLNDTQMRILTTVYAKRTVVLLYDPEAYEKQTVKRVIRRLKNRLPSLLVAHLPKGTDPGSLDRRITRAIVEDQAKDAKVKISWEKI